MSWLDRMLAFFTPQDSRRLPSSGRVDEVIKQSRAQRRRTRPVIDRAAALAEAYEKGDLALHGR